MNYPAAGSGVSEDRNSMIIPPHPDPLPRGERERCCYDPLPRGEREQCYPAAS